MSSWLRHAAENCLAQNASGGGDGGAAERVSVLAQWLWHHLERARAATLTAPLGHAAARDLANACVEQCLALVNRATVASDVRNERSPALEDARHLLLMLLGRAKGVAADEVVGQAATAVAH